MARETPAVPISLPRDAASLVDWSVALDIVGGDAALLADVLEAFLVEAPRQSRAIEQAINAGDAAALHLAAHTLKSSLRYLGAKESQDLAYQLEQACRSGAVAKAGAGTDIKALSKDLARRMEQIMVEATTEWRRLRGATR
jgi:HPt (histidine-containing phosphotransfer) domain-containing protein